MGFSTYVCLINGVKVQLPAPKEVEIIVDCGCEPTNLMDSSPKYCSNCGKPKHDTVTKQAIEFDLNEDEDFDSMHREHFRGWQVISSTYGERDGIRFIGNILVDRYCPKEDEYDNLSDLHDYVMDKNYLGIRLSSLEKECREAGMEIIDSGLMLVSYYW